MTIKIQRLLDRAKKSAKKGDIQEAKNLYTSILEQSPDNKEAKSSLVSLNLVKNDVRAPKEELKLVIDLYSNGQIQEALKAIQALIQEFPKEPILYNISGACFQSIGKPKLAVTSFETALEIEPNYLKSYFRKSKALVNMGKLKEALELIEVGEEAEP